MARDLLLFRQDRQPAQQKAAKIASDAISKASKKQVKKDKVDKDSLSSVLEAEHATSSSGGNIMQTPTGMIHTHNRRKFANVSVKQQEQPLNINQAEYQKNVATVKNAFDNNEPMADIQFGGRNVTVYGSQMYAITQTLIGIADENKRERKKQEILGTYDGWLKFVLSKLTRQWVGRYQYWLDQQRKVQKRHEREIGQPSLPGMGLEETVLNYVADTQGFTNWKEAAKILEESEFVGLLQRAARLLKQVKENEIPGHSMGFKPGPGGPGSQSNAPDGGHLSLGEKITAKKATKRSVANKK